MDKLTQEELAQKNGKDGQPGLVAVDGKIYDISQSRMWRNGVHMKSHEAGQDLTEAIQAAPHGKDVLERFQQIGELTDPNPEAPDRFDRAPAFVEFILDRHPHPVSVHFPVGLLVVAAVLTLLALVTGDARLDFAAWVNLIGATIVLPGTIATGLLSWFYNYGGIWTGTYKAKASLSVLLVVLAVAAIVLRLATGTSLEQPNGVYYAYAALVLAAAPVVMLTGFFGGKITFPR